MKNSFLSHINFDKLKNTHFDVIVCMGQSNCKGYGKGDKDLAYSPDEDILLFCDNKLSVAKERRSSLFDYRGVFPLYFCQLYKEKLLQENSKILLVQCAVGGTSFSDNRWGLGNDLYENAVNATMQVLNSLPYAKLRCAIWHQGETDAENSVSSQYYYEKLSSLIDDFRKRTNSPLLPFIAGDYVPEWKNTCPCSFKISNATKQVINDKQKCAYVESDGLKGNDYPDHIHFCRKSLKEFGKRYFDKYLQLISD